MKIPLAALALLAAVAGCKPDSTKVQMGPLTADRYEIPLADGSKQFCYVFGADSNQPVRLCGDGGPTPNNVAVLFSATAPPRVNEFSEKIGPPRDPGYYLLKPLGASRADSWFLGKLGTREWLAEKRLLAVDTTPDHVTHVRVIDPEAHADRTFEAKTTTSEFMLVRAPNDVALLLVQKNGGEEVLLLENPVENPILSITNVSDGKSPGNRKFYAAGSIDRLHHGIFQPPTGTFGHITWNGTRPLYDNALLGPFEAVN
jgi:hypothetical protein